MGFAIIVENIKHEVNLGTLARSAINFGASMICTVGRRYKPQCSDTTAAHRHIPTLHFLDWEDCRNHLPYGWLPIAVEITSNARSIVNFCHPKSAVYLLGPEDGSLSKQAIDIAKYTISIPSLRCLNVATAGSIVMYDRVAKEIRNKTKI